MQKLTKQLGRLKGDILDLIRQDYVDFDSFVDNTHTLERQLRDILKEQKCLTTRVEQDLRGKITNAVTERPAVEKNLKKSKHRIDLVQKFVVVYLGIENARKTLCAEKCVVCAGHVRDASISLEGLQTDKCNALVFRSLKTELADVESQLISKLSEEWNKFVTWSPPTLPDLHKTSIELSIATGSGLVDIIKAMKLLPLVWSHNVNGFAKKLFSMFIKPIITSSEPLDVVLSTKGVSKTLKIILQSSKYSISHLYANLNTVLNFAKEVVSVDNEWSTGLGDVVCADMCQLIVAHWLSTTIPRDSQELTNYDTLSSETQMFETGLVTIGFVKEGACETLTQYTKQVNSHFAIQKSVDLLTKARNTLMQPLHTTLLISEQNKALQQLHTMVDQKECFGSDLSGLSFGFPQCAVSKCIIEYVDLLYSTLKECCESSTPLATQLLSTCRSMIDLFCSVIPSHHCQSISDIPGIAMTQHNNCMYLTHHLITLGHQFHSLLPQPLNTSDASFIDLVPIVRKLGEVVYKREIKKQSATIIDILASSGSLDNVSETEQSQAVQRGTQQVILHITKIGQVYCEVLPVEIHCRAIGGLLNVAVCELVKAVLVLEDIAVDDATELHAILTNFLEHAPSVFTTGHQLVKVYCRDWGKLRELAVVLDASLQKIVDMWGKGKGVLASAFTPMELRGLIKALFKNTDRRAAALAKITL